MVDVPRRTTPRTGVIALSPSRARVRGTIAAAVAQPEELRQLRAFHKVMADVNRLRIVRRLVKLHDFDEGEPYAFVECVQTIFPVKGTSTPLSPGAVFEYEVPDIYGRPWAQTWRKYWERGMEAPQQDDLFKF